MHELSPRVGRVPPSIRLSVGPLPLLHTHGLTGYEETILFIFNRYSPCCALACQSITTIHLISPTWLAILICCNTGILLVYPSLILTIFSPSSHPILSSPTHPNVHIISVCEQHLRASVHTCVPHHVQGDQESSNAQECCSDVCQYFKIET